MSMSKQNKTPKRARRLKLHWYQELAVVAAISHAFPGTRNMVVLPTGGGKSVVIAEIVKRLPDLQILIIVPRRSLLKQLLKRLRAYGVLSSKLGNDLGDRHKLVVGTVQTIMRRKIVPPDVMIVDENHVGNPDGAYGALIRDNPQAAVIGLTATPYRQNELITEASIEWKQVYSISISELIGQGFLVPPRSKATSAAAGEVFCATRSETVDEVTERIVPKLVKAVRRQERKKCLVFCIDIKHAELTSKLLKHEGQESVYIVHSRQSRQVQDAMVGEFEQSNEPAWLVNVGLVSFGVDIPAIDCIAILRDIRSFALLVQIIGRGLRTFIDKMDCLVYDFGGGTRRFGFVDSPRLPQPSGGFDSPGQKRCPSCRDMNHLSALKCRCCAHAFPRFTSLSDTAISHSLLLREFATYLGSQTMQDDRGVWQEEHRLSQGQRTLRARTDSLTEPDPSRPLYKLGRRLIVEHVAEDLVEIIG